MVSRRLLVLCALTCVCVATKLPPAVENAVDFCVSSRWGFSCFDASASGRGMMARAGLANFGRMVGRGALVTMGAALARETWVTIKELQQSQAGMAHPAVALRQWLLEGPLPPATAAAAAAPAGVTTGPAVEAAVAPDAVSDSVAAEPAEPTPAAEAAGVAAVGRLGGYCRYVSVPGVGLDGRRSFAQSMHRFTHRVRSGRKHIAREPHPCELTSLD